jgi:23S rRNA (pseudouridine1915-N3)-methyltransferase
LKLLLLTVGKPGRLLLPAIDEYEKRAARYWSFEVIEVKEERATKSASDEYIRSREAERLLKRIPVGSRVIALTRTGGDAFSSERFARHLSEFAAHGADGVAFLIGGAFGLGEEALVRADRRLKLSTFTLSHDIARLVLAEQLYRAGTILRGEPYHKGARDE